MTRVQEYVRKICSIRDLPTLPVAAQRLLASASNDDAAAGELCEIIGSDPALSVKILRVANSAYYGYRSRIGTIEEAVLLIGTQVLKQLSLGVMVFDAFGGVRQKRMEFWQHSLFVASAGAAIAQNTSAASPELSFMGGLLHRIGQLIIETYPPGEDASVIDQAEVGAWFAQRWQLPRELVETIAFYAKPGRANPEYAPLVACVHLAEAVSRSTSDCAAGSLDPGFDPEALNILGLAQETVLEIAAAIKSGNKLEKGVLQ
jgi:HD-like signal output (HDOD) protein